MGEKLRSLVHTLRSRPGELAIAIGIGTLGVTTYIFLLLTGRVLGDADYAPLGALWILVFLVCPAVLYPIEQELSRAIAARRALGQGIRPLVVKASQLGGILTLVSVVLIALCGPVLNDQFFDGDTSLFIAFVLAMVTYAVAYVGRGLFAGNRNLSGYGWIIAGEGVWRLLPAIAFAIVGVKAAGWYGLLVGICPLISVSVVAARMSKRQRHEYFDDGPAASMRELSASLGTLIVASLLSQVLVNVAPLLVKYNASDSQQALAGAFAKAVVVTRIPLFLFQALQAATLPRLTHLATVGEHETFRSYFRTVLVGVAVIGGLGTIAAFAMGDFLLRLFGSEGSMGRTDIALLAAGSAVFLLALQAAQALVAVNRQARTIVGWGAGVIGFGLGMFVSGDLIGQAVYALLIGSAVAFVAMMALLYTGLGNVNQEIELSDTPQFVLE